MSGIKLVATNIHSKLLVSCIVFVIFVIFVAVIGYCLIFDSQNVVKRRFEGFVLIPFPHTHFVLRAEAMGNMYLFYFFSSCTSVW